MFRDLRIGGLPVVQKVQRDELTLDAKIKGEATHIGVASIVARAFGAWFQWRRRSHAGGPGRGDSRCISLSAGRASTNLNVADTAAPPRRRAGSEIGSAASGRPIGSRLACLRASNWGPGVAPDQAIRWEGKGRYDLGQDELFVEHRSPVPLARRPSSRPGSREIRNYTPAG